MVAVAERSTTFMIASPAPGNAQLPVPVTGGVGEQFAAAQKVSRELGRELSEAIVAKGLDVEELGQLHAKNQRWTLRSLVTAVGAAAGTGIAFSLGFGWELMAGALAVGLGAGAGGGQLTQLVLRSQDVKRIGHAKRQETETQLDGILSRMQTMDVTSPAELVAVSAVAERQLRDTKITDADSRKRLATVVWRAEKSLSTAQVDRATKWLALQDALADFKQAQYSFEQPSVYAAVSEAFDALCADDKAGLAATVREALFDDEKPRFAVHFAVAAPLFDKLCALDPSVTPNARKQIAKPDGEAGVSRYASEVFAFEQALSLALHPQARTIAKVIEPLKSQPHQRNTAGNELGLDVEAMRHATSTLNQTIAASAIADAIDRALADWHTPLERAGLATVAQRALLVIDACSVLGREARTMLRAVIEASNALPPIAEAPADSTMGDGMSAHDVVKADAKRITTVLDAFGRIDATSKSDGEVAAALQAFEANIKPDEAAALASVVGERVFGVQMRDDEYFPGSVELYRYLRGKTEGVTAQAA